MDWRKESQRSINLALAAACLGALLLTGCDSGSNTQVQQDSRDAANLALSAGEPRATDALVDAVANGATTANPSQIVRNDADKDLAAAISKLTSALATADLSLATKSSLQAQTGGTQWQLAQYKYDALQTQIRTLNKQALEIETLAATALNLLAQADVLEKNTRVPSADASNQAAGVAAQKQQAAAAAQAKAEDLQKQITGKQAQAQQIYSATEAAFTAADAVKGKEGIAAANKAMDDRKQAEDLMAEAGKLAPDLARAQAEADLAKIAKDAADELATLSKAAYDQAQKDFGASTDRIGKLRAAAAKIVGKAGDKDSLTVRVGEFLTQAAKIDKLMRDAVAAADQADASFAAAKTSYDAYVLETRKKADDAQLDSKDPLRVVINDDRPAALLSWSDAAAQQLGGRIFLAGDQVSSLITGITDQAKSLKIATDTAISLDGTFCRTEAAKRFNKAVALTKNVNASKSPTLTPLGWIGKALEATANQGAGAAGNSDAAKAAAGFKTAAVTANPAQADQLDWIK